MYLASHRFSVVLLGTVLTFQAESRLLAQFTDNDADDETRTIRSRVAASLSPDEAEDVLREAFSDQATAYVTAIRGAGSELELLDLERSLTAARLPSAASERALLGLASRLGAVGSTASLSLLQQLGKRQAEVVVYVEGCRGKMPVPLFDYPQAAKRAEFQILELTALTEFEGLVPAASADWFVEISEDDLASPRLSAALKVVGELSPESRELLRHQLLQQVETQLTPTAGELLVEIYRADVLVPQAEEFRRLPTGAAQRFVLESTAKGPPERASEVLRVARSHPGVASLAAFLDASRGLSNPRQYLQRDGATAAAVLARDKSPRMTRLLAAILADRRASADLERHTVLALLHQGTDVAKAAILDALAAADVPPSLAKKLERGLDR